MAQPVTWWSTIYSTGPPNNQSGLWDEHSSTLMDESLLSYIFGGCINEMCMELDSDVDQWMYVDLN